MNADDFKHSPTRRFNYFVFIINQVNNHGLSRRWIADTEIKHLKSGAFRTITNIAEKESTSYGKLKRIPSQTLCSWIQKYEFLCRYFLMTLLIDLDLPAKMYF